MAFYFINGKATVSFGVNVEADTEEEAIRDLENNMELHFDLSDGDVRDVLEVTVETVEELEADDEESATSN